MAQNNATVNLRGMKLVYLCCTGHLDNVVSGNPLKGWNLLKEGPVSKCHTGHFGHLIIWHLIKYFGLSKIARQIWQLLLNNESVRFIVCMRCIPKSSIFWGF